ncbi:hypothetical protein D3C76_1541970 [compost metagenome]
MEHNSPFGSASQQFRELSGAAFARHDAYACNAGFLQLVDPVHNHGQLPDGKQVLVDDPRQRIKARALAARKNNSLHQPSPPSDAHIYWRGSIPHLSINLR